MENLKINRSFTAPRELIWRVWSEAAHLAHWFGPKGFPIVHAKLDFKEGGIYHYAMELPGGSRMWGKWTFREIVPNERIAFVVTFSDEQGGVSRHPMVANWPLELQTIITFTEEGDSTGIHIDGHPLNASDLEQQVFEFGKPGMQAGWAGTFAQLEAYLETLKTA